MKNQGNAYFQEWYFKCQKNAQAVSFLPTICFAEDGSASVTLQIITRIQVIRLCFQPEEFYLDPKGNYLKIGNNLFSKNGIHIDYKGVDCNGKKVRLSGSFTFGRLNPVKRLKLPYCSLFLYQTDLLSLEHTVNGSLSINGKHLSIHRGYGSLQRIYGKELPQDYFYTQYLTAERGYPLIHTAVCGYPFYGKQRVTGSAIIRYHGRTLHFSPCLGCKVLIIRPSLAILSQGKNLLLIHRYGNQGRPVRVPTHGKMERIVHEELLGKARYEFYHGTRKIFDLKTHRATLGYEQCEK